MPFTSQQKLDAIKREIGHRVRVYERLVTDGKMTRAKADYETAIMREIAADYENTAAAERLI